MPPQTYLVHIEVDVLYTIDRPTREDADKVMETIPLGVVERDGTRFNALIQDVQPYEAPDRE